MVSSSAEKTMDEPSPAKWLSDNKSGSAAVSPSTSTSIATLFEEGTSERTSDRTRQHACLGATATPAQRVSMGGHARPAAR